MNTMARHPDYASLTVADFRAKVADHLARAQRKMPNAIPHDVFDPAIEPMMDELEALDSFLHGFGYDERRMEDQESEREQREKATRANVTLEDAVMLVDERVQSAMLALTGERTATVLLAPMHADMVAMAFVQFLDAFPREAFSADRIIPPGFASSRDTTVAGLIRLMRERKAAQ